MRSRPHLLCVRLLSIVLSFVAVSSGAWAHGFVGQRMFIEPLFAEDANIKNELDLPRIEVLTLPDGSFRTFDAVLEKPLYRGRWSVVVEQSRIRRHDRGERLPLSDLMTLRSGPKVAVYRSEKHEFILTPALFMTVPSGSRSVAERHTAIHPALLFAKGLGDLKIGWLRPLAFQGDIGFEASATGERQRNAIYNVVLFYSVPSLDHFIDRIVPRLPQCRASPRACI
jgi:hypothetical protein